MAKSVSVLLAVLAVAVSLHAAHAGVLNALAESVLPKVRSFRSWIDNNSQVMINVKEKADALKDRAEVLIDKYGDPDKQDRFTSMTFTAIEVGGKKLEDSQGSVILINNFPNFLFLDKNAFGLLKNEFPGGEPNAKFDQVCTAAPAPEPDTLVSLVYTHIKNGKDVDEKGELSWYTRNDSSKCLRVFKV